MSKNILTILVLFLVSGIAASQEFPISFEIGEKYNDRYKYSNLLTIADDGSGGTILVRAYYSGLILQPKGYLVEHYNKDLELIDEYNYKLKGHEFVNGYVKNGQLYLLFLDYNLNTLSYEYTVHRSPITDYRFTEQTLLSIASDPVDNPLDKNYYNRNFGKGFTTTVLFDDDFSAFIISTHYKKGNLNKHRIHVFSTSLNKIMEHDFSEAVEDKNYAFEQLEVSPDLKTVYVMGKAYFKRKRFKAMERKFQYELIRITPEGRSIQTFDGTGKYSEALKPMLNNDKLICVGFYADRKDNRYNGLGYFSLDPVTLDIRIKKYNPFSAQFMLDKFGKDDAQQVKNLVFKNVSFAKDGCVQFNAEEYFVTNSVQANSSGGRVRVERFHHNDIVSAKLGPSGELIWARNINKTEVTQGDGAYVSYCSFTKGGDTYFFISSAAENPELLNNERLIFKQGFSRNRNVFVIRLDDQGVMSYKKMIDSKEARLPLMVSKPLMDKSNDALLFYAKRGTKKQLVNFSIN
ncbi:hypothetical protein [Lentiprolixibacter aurantiacus]|uniref:Uncharacterized protein n=1 Tax=Lentiprolixibacter aurantiacus TaxID=2993939 RepID=A0AAE3MJG1_9FLAO|nr:hypothetical protein [Lentiprolixibacter aurantiacus]MCX2718683.1 hypothetical protein [Lentiprolixibacter aurantiacus]